MDTQDETLQWSQSWVSFMRVSALRQCGRGHKVSRRKAEEEAKPKSNRVMASKVRSCPREDENSSSAVFVPKCGYLKLKKKKKKPPNLTQYEGLKSSQVEKLAWKRVGRIHVDQFWPWPTCPIPS